MPEADLVIRVCLCAGVTAYLCGGLLGLLHRERAALLLVVAGWLLALIVFGVNWRVAGAPPFGAAFPHPRTFSAPEGNRHDGQEFIDIQSAM